MLGMCRYISASHVMPGYICCQCKCYNGLQRVETVAGKILTLCKFFHRSKHGPGCELLDLPATGIAQCANCFAGYDVKPDGSPLIPTATLAGKRFNELFCVVCGALFVKRTPETDKAFTGKATR